MRPKILFIDTTHPIFPATLEQEGYQCDAFANYSSYEDYKNIIHEYVGVVVRSKIKLDKTILKAAKQLKFIARVGAGMENIDTDAAADLGIACLNAPEGNRAAVAEHALGMILALRNHLVRVNTEVRQGIWKRAENRGLEMKGKTLAIIGYGFMGKAFSKRLQGLDMNVIAYDKYLHNFSNSWVKEVSLETVFEQADIISLHVPLTEETHYMFNKAWINKMQKPFYVINTSRGQVLNTADLLQGIREGKVLGAGLDVLEFEGLSFEALGTDNENPTLSALMQNDKVLLSPHIAGWTIESHEKLSTVLLKKINEFMRDSI